MKVLLCSPYKGIVGGISRWTNHVIKFYNENRQVYPELEVEFYSTDRQNKVYANTSLIKRVLLGIKDYIPVLRKYQKTITRNKFDVVHITTSASISLLKDLLMLKIARKKNVKTVIHFRFGRIPELYKKKNWEYRLINKVIKSADIVIVLDKRSYDVLITEGFTNIKILPNPLTPEIGNIIKLNNVIREKRKILFAGHLIPTKGIFELVEACKDMPDIVLTMIGYGTDDMKNKLMMLSDNGSWLEIKGEQSYENTILEMMSSQIFVLPTYTEGFPNVILESMACGCSIVASRVGAIPEMLNDGDEKICGICIEPQKPVEIKKAILKFLDDEDFAQLCSQNAVDKVNKNYSMPNVWDLMHNLWKSLLYKE